MHSDPDGKDMTTQELCDDIDAFSERILRGPDDAWLVFYIPEQPQWPTPTLPH